MDVALARWGLQERIYYSKRFGGSNRERFQGLGGVHWSHSISEPTNWKITKNYSTWNLVRVVAIFLTSRCRNQSNTNEYGEGYY